MKFIFLLISILMFSVSSWAEKDNRYKKGEVSQELAQQALKDGVLRKLGGVALKRIITQSINVSGVHQVEDSNTATIYFSFVAKGSDAAKYATAKIMRFNSGYWYFPSSNKYLTK